MLGGDYKGRARKGNRKCAPLRGTLHASGASEADGDAAVLDNDGNLAAAREPDHPIQLRPVLLHVDVADRILPTRVVLTGRGRVGSGVLAEDLHPFLVHPASAAPMIRRRRNARVL